MRDIWLPGTGLAGTKDSMAQNLGYPGKFGMGGNPNCYPMMVVATSKLKGSVLLYVVMFKLLDVTNCCNV